MPRGKHNNHSRGEQHPRWKTDGVLQAANGYLKVRVGKEHPLADPHGYAYQHRLVASEMVGRLLTSCDIVHHKNGDKTDNSPENLEVTTRAAHNRHHNECDKERNPSTGRFERHTPKAGGRELDGRTWDEFPVLVGAGMSLW